MYRIWNLADFESVNLASDVYASVLKVQRPNEFAAVKVSTEDWEFPLRGEYIRKNRSYEGMKEKVI